MSLGFTLAIDWSSAASKKTPSRTATRADSYPLGSARLRPPGPAPRPGHRLAPATDQLVPLERGHPRLEGRGLPPHLAHLLDAPEAGGDAREVGGAEGG